MKKLDGIYEVGPGFHWLVTFAPVSNKRFLITGMSKEKAKKEAWNLQDKSNIKATPRIREVRLDK